MSMGVVSLVSLAFILGFKHSYDPDHLLVVSAFLRKAQSLKNAVSFGISWAAGHMLTAGGITIILFLLKDAMLESILGYFEYVVGPMLVLLGAWSMSDFFMESDPHTHGRWNHRHFFFQRDTTPSHTHCSMFLVGVVQGLASNDELLLLFTIALGIESLAATLFGVGVFSIGVVIGMATFCAVWSISWLNTLHQSYRHIFSLVAGCASIGFGISMLV